MPIHVDIRINEDTINKIHIGRISGGTKPNDLNTYIVVEDVNVSVPDWEEAKSVEFVHRYGDGAEVCVALALKALGYTGQRTGTNPPRQVSKSWDGSGWDYTA